MAAGGGTHSESVPGFRTGTALTVLATIQLRSRGPDRSRTKFAFRYPSFLLWRAENCIFRGVVRRPLWVTRTARRQMSPLQSGRSRDGSLGLGIDESPLRSRGHAVQGRHRPDRPRIMMVRAVYGRKRGRAGRAERAALGSMGRHSLQFALRQVVVGGPGDLVGGHRNR